LKTLIITEKPSVAMDLSKVLGSFARHDGYLEKSDMIITWAVGHLVELAMPQDYDPALEKWSLDTLPILPEFKLKPKPSTAKQLNIIKSLISRKDVNRLINACDAGREGELIFRNIIQFLNCKKPHDRLWLSETTATAIKNAFASLRTSAEVENLARAATARSQADWLIGINATRGYTAKHREKLTVGRVQTPALALIVNRDREISNFKPVPFYEIEAEFNTASEQYKGKWFKEKQDRFENRTDAEAVMAKLSLGSPAHVVGIETKEKTEQPPVLFNLTDLQKEANQKFGLTAEETLNIAQKLYENRLITYPRTDSRHLTTAMVATLPARLNALRMTELGPIVTGIVNTNVSNKRFVDDTKVTDHTAIVVTETSPDLSTMTKNQVKIYLLVARRMVGIFLPDAKIKLTTVITSCQSETFISRGKIVLEPGWRVLYGKKEEDILPTLIQGQKVTLKQAIILDKETQPPKRYTEASLLSAMENAGKQVTDAEMRNAMQNKGLGTPATRAAVIEKLIATGYIVRQKKNLTATEKGAALIDIVSTQLKSPELTGEWEKKLLDIEYGKYHSSTFMQEIAKLTQDLITEIKQASVSDFKAVKPASTSIGSCPLCKSPVVENKKAYGCSNWKSGCKFVIWKTIASKKITQAQAKKILKGRSDLIKGFKAKNGNNFNAYLKLAGDKINFEFETTRRI
jgi:DNA topoisomerase-3